MKQEIAKLLYNHPMKEDVLDLIGSLDHNKQQVAKGIAHLLSDMDTDDKHEVFDHFWGIGEKQNAMTMGIYDIIKNDVYSTFTGMQDTDLEELFYPDLDDPLDMLASRVINWQWLADRVEELE